MLTANNRRPGMGPDGRARGLSAASGAIRKGGPGLGLCGLAIGAFALRVLLIDRQSAYMDESTFILTGRYLLEHRSVYAGAPTWTYGSYLWALLAGGADMVGGLLLVRVLTAVCGAAMALATALTAAALAPRAAGPHRWPAALFAGLLMATLPTALAVGRFGTYDALAGATFMGGVTLLVAIHADERRLARLAAAGLLFVAFLAKYLVAIYLPFICLYALLAPRTRAALWRNLAWFVAPLSVACAGYFVAFRGELLTLLRFSTGYTDLASPTPLREYLWQRPELWALAGLAALGWRRTTRLGRLVAASGAVIILGFHALTRPDFDFWKHSIYIIFFLAPPAGLALAWLIPATMGHRRRHTATMRVALPMVAALVAPALVALALGEANRLVTFYPNLNPSVSAIRAAATGACRVLTDDSAVRYYLHPQLPTERVSDPFSIDYRGQQGLEGYRRAVADRYFDAIVLDGGIGPLGRRLKPALGELLARHYEQVYAGGGHAGTALEIYQPREQPLSVAEPVAGAIQVYRFDVGPQGWGGHADGAGQQPDFLVAVDHERPWRGQASLRFTVDERVTVVGVQRTAPVSQVRARVYVDAPGERAAVPVGMIGFDQDWRWRDDGFNQSVPVGCWAELTWQLAEPGLYREIGLKFPADTALTVHLGQIEIRP